MIEELLLGGFFLFLHVAGLVGKHQLDGLPVYAPHYLVHAPAMRRSNNLEQYSEGAMTAYVVAA